LVAKGKTIDDHGRRTRENGDQGSLPVDDFL
jgi:hypothetical protein